MDVEWDENKRETNIEDHGIDFVRAAKIFDNPIVERLDERQDYGEDRYIAIGHWNEEFLVVVYTWRRSNRRIISAWKAGRDEKRTYNDSLTQ